LPMLVDEAYALMTQKEFDELPEYSCSLPTATTVGKRWKHGSPYVGERTRWTMGEYVEHADPTMVGILWREVLIG
jgi:hypothetical protein